MRPSKAVLSVTPYWAYLMKMTVELNISAGTYWKVYVCDCRRGMDWRMDVLAPFGSTDTYSAIADLRTLQITSTR
jgi:hypothetical protein